MKHFLFIFTVLLCLNASAFAGTVNCKVEAVENDTQKSMGKVTYDLKREESVTLKGSLVDGRFPYQIEVNPQAIQAHVTDMKSLSSAFGLDLTRRMTGPTTALSVPASLFVVGSFAAQDSPDPRINVTVYCLEAP